jgi:hypothetical protein
MEKQDVKETDIMIDTLLKTGAASEWLKEFNDKNDSLYKNYSDNQIEEMYYNNMDRMHIAAENKDYEKAFAEAQFSLPLLKRFIQIQYSKYNGFDIKGIPAIDFCLEYSSSMGLNGILENVADIIKGHTELLFIYSDDLKKFQELSVISKNIRKILTNNPVILQNLLLKYFSETQARQINKSVKYMEEFGLIERVMEGTTYKLKLTRESGNDQ